jgi:hypothetical protein
MLSNSLVASVLAACYVLVVILQLNPTLPLHPLRIAPLALAVMPFYIVHGGTVCYLLLLIRRLFAREHFSPAWVSVSVLSWLSAVVAAAGAALMWANLAVFAPVLPDETARAMAGGAVAVGAASLLFVIVALSRPRVRSGPRVVASFCVAAIAAGSLIVPMVLRGRGVVEPLPSHALDVPADVPPDGRASRVTILALDAGSLELVAGAAAEGRLPNFGRILDAGAVMHLATLHPTSADAVWAAAATGKLPQKNGVRSAGIYRLRDGDLAIRLLPDYCYASGLVRFGFLETQPHRAATLRARTLWDILSAYGIEVGVVNWPLTRPVSPVRGYIVSDDYAERALTAESLDGRVTLYPPELEGATLLAIGSSHDAADAGIELQAMAGDRRVPPGRVDQLYDTIAARLQVSWPVRVSIVRYGSLDPIGHYFLRYAMPSEFGDVSPDERHRLGSVLERHYELIDDAIGRAIASLGPDDLLLVVSGYGMEPLGFGKRLLEQVLGDPAISGTHEDAPDGFLLAYGASVQKTRLLNRASVVDLVPTTLYFLGLPIGRDMDGFARTDLFKPEFSEVRPITAIPTYER